MTIEELRKEIDNIDTQLVHLLNLRYHFCLQIGKLKQLNSTEVLDSNREQDIIYRLSQMEQYSNMVQIIWPTIMKYSRDLQSEFSGDIDFK